MRDYEFLQECRKGGMPNELYFPELRKVAARAEVDEDFYTAARAYRELEDKESLRKVGNTCLQDYTHWAHDAVEIFSYLGDREMWIKSLASLARRSNNSPTLMDDYFREYLAPYQKSILKRFEKWSASKGFSKSLSIYTGPTINMANQIAGNYDLGIPIAADGLGTGYIFNLFGLPIKIVKAHRYGTGATFEWIDDIKEKDIANKKLAVFDIDVASGRTSRRVLKELQKYRPKCIDLILTHSPVSSCERYGTRAENIPKGYRQTIYPKDFSYDNFGDAEKKLVEKLRQVA